MAYMERNNEGYPDPTASTALQTIEREERAKRLGFMPLVYICSPFAGDVERNVQNARRYSAFTLTQKALPVAPHLLFPQFMDGGRLPGGEETEETRELALHMGLILLSKCHEVWYFGDTVSEGMKKELNRARWRNMIVRHFTDDCTEVQI